MSVRLSREMQQTSEPSPDNENQQGRNRERMKSEGREEERGSRIPRERGFLSLAQSLQGRIN